MNCTDSDERWIREFRMKAALDDLSKDFVAQRSYMRLEPPPGLTPDRNKGKGKVFDYHSTGEMAGNVLPEIEERQLTENKEDKGDLGDKSSMSEHLRPPSATRFDNHGSMVPSTPPNMKHNPNIILPEGAEKVTPTIDISGFQIGCVDASSSSTNNKSRNSRGRSNSWSRKKRNFASINSKDAMGSQQPEDRDKESDHVNKRKAVENVEVSSKISKQAVGLMVHQKPSSTNI